MKTYELNGQTYSLKPYSTLTQEQDDFIVNVLNFGGNSEAVLTVENTTELLKLILLPESGKEPIDVKKLSYEQIFDILSDFIAERADFLAGMSKHFQSLLELKLKSSAN